MRVCFKPLPLLVGDTVAAATFEVRRFLSVLKVVEGEVDLPRGPPEPTGGDPVNSVPNCRLNLLLISESSL